MGEIPQTEETPCRPNCCAGLERSLGPPWWWGECGWATTWGQSRGEASQCLSAARERWGAIRTPHSDCYGKRDLYDKWCRLSERWCYVNRSGRWPFFRVLWAICFANPKA